MRFRVRLTLSDETDASVGLVRVFSSARAAFGGIPINIVKPGLCETSIASLKYIFTYLLNFTTGGTGRIAFEH